MLTIVISLSSVSLLCFLDPVESTNGHNSDILSSLDPLEKSVSSLVKYVHQSRTPNSKNLLKHARELDTNDCLLRAVCEISSNFDDPSESPVVQKVRKIFGRNRKEIVLPKTDDAIFPFAYAGYIGASSGTAERCLQIFPVCELDSTVLLRMLSNSSKAQTDQLIKKPIKTTSFKVIGRDKQVKTFH